MTSNLKPSKSRVKPSTIRTAVRLIVFIIVVIGLVAGIPLGTYSSIGFDSIAAICPLGALETIFGSWAFVPRLIIALVAMLIIVFFLGRAFCSWICPVPPISEFLKTKKVKQADHDACGKAGKIAYDRYRHACTACGGSSSCTEGCDPDDGDTAQAGKLSGSEAKPTIGKAKTRDLAQFDSRHIVLAGTLGSAAIFGFPVFCLVCPIGLTCATVVAFIRLVGFNEPSWGLLLFPLIIIAELTLCRKFCAKICPVAALMSLVSRFSRTFRPTVNESSCLRLSKGEECHACATACPNHIDPHSNLGLVPVSECTRCMKCAQACPGNAIHFPFIATARHTGHDKRRDHINAIDKEETVQ